MKTGQITPEPWERLGSLVKGDQDRPPDTKGIGSRCLTGPGKDEGGLSEQTTPQSSTLCLMETASKEASLKQNGTHDNFPWVVCRRLERKLSPPYISIYAPGLLMRHTWRSRYGHTSEPDHTPAPQSKRWGHSLTHTGGNGFHSEGFCCLSSL